MKANELRIGNWIQAPAEWNDDKNHFENVEVYEISSYGNGIEIGHSATGMNGSASSCVSDVKPIDITEEWLIKFGFKKWKSKGVTYSKGNFILHLRKRGWVINKRTVEPKWVHQFQNLYFAIKGEELQYIYNPNKV